MFAFEVEYLLGRVYAGDFRDRSECEWPPHPARLFSALAAAYFESGKKETEKAALQWLEDQGPPSIHAGEPGTPVKVTAFVPTNYPGDGPPVLRDKQPRVFPAQGPSEATVHFVWPRAEPVPEIRGALDELASRTGYLGKACSLVRMCVVDSPPVPNFEPDSRGREVLRAVGGGRLQELSWLFDADQRPSAGVQQRYRNIKEGEVRPAVVGAFDEMLVFRRTDGKGVPIEGTLTLTQAVRKALMSQAGGGGAMPAAISGHGEEAHCAIAALPFISSDHADGHVMGFAIILPRQISAVDRRAVIAAGVALEDGGVNLGAPMGNWRVAMETSPIAKTLQPETWTRESRWWATATPILLDRFPKKKGPTVEDLIGAACVRIGLPVPHRVEHGPFSKEAGVPPVPEFRLIRKKDDRPRWGVHARLEFESAVQGPVLLGAGRYFGMGLMKPVREWKTND